MSNQIIDKFLDSQWLEKGLSRNTLESYGRDLKAYSTWLEQQPLELLQVRREDLLRYLAARMGSGLKARSTARALSCLRGLYRYLLRENLIRLDPTLRIDNPKLGRPLPDTLSEQDIDRLLGAPDPLTLLGLRDRTMLEVLYATGLRVTELVSLRLTDINLRQGVVRVMGKGSKERLVPLGEEAIAWIEHFLQTAREPLLKNSLY